MCMYIARYIGKFNVYFHDIVQILGVRFTLCCAYRAKQQDNWILEDKFQICYHSVRMKLWD